MSEFPQTPASPGSTYEGGSTTSLLPPREPSGSAGAGSDDVTGDSPAWSEGALASGAGGGAWGPWGVPSGWTPPPPNPSRPHPLRALAAVTLSAALVTLGIGVGLVLANSAPATTTAAASSGSGGSTNNSGSGSGSAGPSSVLPSSATAAQVAAAVDPGLVDVNTELGYQNGSAAGTGMVLTSSGEVLTNNHVVEGATSINVTDIGNGHTYSATVVGTDATHDIAVLKLVGASGLKTVNLGSSSTATVGQAVVGIGNAGGVGGTPSFSSGQISALNQSITASDDASGTSEQLTGLLQTSATLQPGDSGGPLVDMSGKVLAIDTAASSGFQFQGGSDQNYAIPIDQATSIARQIEAGDSSSTIHIGQAAFLGIEVEPVSGLTSSSVSAGAGVVAVEPGSPAATAGLAAGDVIDSLDGNTVDSPDTLSSLMGAHHPGDTVQLGWIDSSGQQHSASVQLAGGPPA